MQWYLHAIWLLAVARSTALSVSPSIFRTGGRLEQTPAYDNASRAAPMMRALLAFVRVLAIHADGLHAIKLLHAEATDALVSGIQRPLPNGNDLLVEGWYRSKETEGPVPAAVAELQGFDGVEGLVFRVKNGFGWRPDRAVDTGDPMEWRTVKWKRHELAPVSLGA